MSSQAVTRRLKQTSELRRLCLALGYKRLNKFIPANSQKSKKSNS